MAVKLLEFPGVKTQNITWIEAVQTIISRAPDTTQNKVVRNMMIIGEGLEDFNFARLNDSEIRSMLGTMECIKMYLMDALTEVTYIDDDEDMDSSDGHVTGNTPKKDDSDFDTDL